MTILSSIPALLKVFTIFAAVLLLNKLKLNLGLSLFIGAIILGCLMGLPPGQLCQSVVLSVANSETINLIAIVGLILILSSLMKETGHLERIVTSFTSLSRDVRIVSAVMPALIGILPMPGGALFSAPMVETALNKNGASADLKTAINYWFRHIWEYWWPLYPGVVLAVGLLNVEVWKFIAFQFYLSLACVLGGIIFLLRPLGGHEKKRKRKFDFYQIRNFFYETMPITIVIMAIVILETTRMILPFLFPGHSLPKINSILLGLIISIIWMLVTHSLTFKKIKTTLFNKNLFSMLVLVSGVMIFKGVLADSSAIYEIRKELISYHIPSLLIITSLPFLAGLITGIAIGFVGASFPLIIPLFSNVSTIHFLAFASLAYAFGYMGMMLSPVHLCLLVTRDYYHASFAGVYFLLIKPVLFVLATSILVFTLVEYFL